MSKSLTAVSRIFRRATGQDELEPEVEAKEEPKKAASKKSAKKVEETTVVTDDKE